MKKHLFPVLTLLLVSGFAAQAQSLGGLLGAKKDDSKQATPAPDVDGVINQGLKIMAFTTIATEIGFKSSMKMLEAFPADKVAELKALAEKVNEAKAKRTKEGNMDSSEVVAVSNFEAAMTKLEANWKSYQKDKAKAVVPAYTGVGLMLAADGLAGAQVNSFLTNAKGAVNSLGSNPMQMTKVKQLNAMVATLTVVSQQIPSQVKSATTIQSIARNIAQAEHFKLAEAPKVTSTDPDALKKLAASAEVEG